MENELILNCNLRICFKGNLKLNAVFIFLLHNIMPKIVE